MAGYRLLLFENRRARRRERVFRDRNNPFDENDDVDMYKKYRFTRLGVQHIIDLVQGELQHTTRRNYALSPAQQVFVALRFFGVGKVLDNATDCPKVSIPTVSRCVRRVAIALCQHRNEYITFPRTAEAVTKAQREFYAIAGFPRVIGAIDCTHVQLHGCPWGDDEFIYVNRKGNHSINVQLICDANYKITNVVARWPGSAHDSRILQNSFVGQRYEAGDLGGMLIGDSGYALKSWLMTPILRPTTASEERYNRGHVDTRIRIEQVNGQLKNKFRCLLGDGLQFEPARACDMITATCVLFNISKFLREPNLDARNDVDVPPELDNVDVPGAGDKRSGKVAQMQIVNDFFVQ